MIINRHPISNFNLNSTKIDFFLNIKIVVELTKLSNKIKQFHHGFEKKFFFLIKSFF